MTVNKKDIEFLYEVGTLRNLERSWKQTLGVSVANDLEHTIRVIYLALLIARGEGVKNEEKIMKMALVHDVAETRTNDSNYVHKVYVEANEKLAKQHIFGGTSLKDLNEEILHEYDERRTIESKIVKDADNLDVDIEMKELEERGHLLPKKWAGFRKKVRNEKLYTKTAKKIWDLIAKSDPASWHLKANKWVNMPKAGL
jgi:putative hydrolase of HD superfamily